MPSQELRDRMNAWAQQHNIGCDCLACGAQQWQTGEIIATPVMGDAESAGMPKQSRMVQVFCGKCGFTLLFNADVVGV